MAQAYQTSDGTVLIIPGAYPNIQVDTSTGGLSVNGVLFLVGEADGGPDYTLETDLTKNWYGPDQDGLVKAKYISGRLVEAFVAAAVPSADTKLSGSPTRIYLIKTNVSGKASKVINNLAGSPYHTLADRGYGELGNLIYFTIQQKTPETVPTTGTFTLLVPNNTTDLNFRVNGGAVEAYQMAALDLPPTTVTNIAALSGLACTGGADRVLLTVSGTLALAASGNQVTVTRSVNWANNPVVGDTYYIPAASPIGGTHAFLQPSVTHAGSHINSILTLNKSGAGGNAVTLTTVADAMAQAGSIAVVGNAITVHYQDAVSTVADFEALFAGGVSVTAGKVFVTTTGTGATVLHTAQDTFGPVSFHSGADENAGSYVVTSFTNTTIVATKLLDASGPAGSLTAPVTVPAWTVLALTDNNAFAPVTISLAPAIPIDGAGKDLEINELTSSTGRLSDLCYQLNTTKVSWISKTGTPTMLTSASEYSVTLNVSRQVDNVIEAISAGGQIALSLGYSGTTATVSITPTGLTTTVAGGTGANLNLLFSKFPTLADLASYINSQPGYSCKVATTLLGQKSPTMLDEVTNLGICTSFGNLPGRIKVDAASFFVAVQTQSGHVQLGTTPATQKPAAAGLPGTVAVNTYLTGGTKGATTDAIYQAAIDALEKLRGNFVVPLFSRDATADIADGLTDSGSSYTLANILAYTKTHVLKMSTMKRRRHRQAFLSIEDSFANDQNAAANLAHGRVALTFQDIIHTSVGNGLVQQQPWMGAVLAAGMQAAAFSKGIVHRTPNQSGVIMKDGSFDPTNDTETEQALLAGLLPLRADDTDTMVWTSDQTTYTKDNNFYWNSIQAVYVADQIALKLSRDMEAALVGESVADVTAPQALNVLKSILGECLRLKLIAPSDDAPAGYKNAKITIKGPVVEVNVEVKLAGLIYFVAINFKVSQVTSTASG